MRKGSCRLVVERSDHMSSPMVIDDTGRQAILGLFESGRSYSQIRNEMGLSAKEFVPFEEFLTIIGATSERDYHRLRASIERKAAVRDKNGLLGKHGMVPHKEDPESWTVLRKRVLESYLGGCLFCDRNASEVHHILGREEHHNSPYLVPVCPVHFNMIHRPGNGPDGFELLSVGERIAQIYPRLYLTLRKTVKISDHESLSYPFLRIQGQEQSTSRYDPCPGWKAMMEDRSGRRWMIMHFTLVVSETGFDLVRRSGDAHKAHEE